jgi:hypothetical protein
MNKNDGLNVSWDVLTFPTEKKNNPFMFQSTNQKCILTIGKLHNWIYRVRKF